MSMIALRVVLFHGALARFNPPVIVTGYLSRNEYREDLLSTIAVESRKDKGTTG